MKNFNLGTNNILRCDASEVVYFFLWNRKFIAELQKRIKNIFQTCHHMLLMYYLSSRKYIKFYPIKTKKAKLKGLSSKFEVTRPGTDPFFECVGSSLWIPSALAQKKFQLF